MIVSVVNSAGDTFCWNYAIDTFYGNYTSDYIYCIFAGFEVVFSVTGMLVDLSVTSSNFIFRSLTDSLFHKIDQKTFKSVISGLHFTTFLNILPKLRYFEGRNDIKIGYKSYSVIFFS